MARGLPVDVRRENSRPAPAWVSTHDSVANDMTSLGWWPVGHYQENGPDIDAYRPGCPWVSRKQNDFGLDLKVCRRFSTNWRRRSPAPSVRMRRSSTARPQSPQHGVTICRSTCAIRCEGRCVKRGCRTMSARLNPRSVSCRPTGTGRIEAVRNDPREDPRNSNGGSPGRSAILIPVVCGHFVVIAGRETLQPRPAHPLWQDIRRLERPADGSVSIFTVDRDTPFMRTSRPEPIHHHRRPLSLHT